jgi:GTPase SAR1 family protein
VGKTCLVDFLTTGSIPEPKKYKPDLYVRKVPGRRFQLRELKLNIPPLKQLPGFSEGYSVWKEAVSEADIVLYLLRVDQLMASHKPTENRVQKDIRQIKKWLDKLEEEDKRKKYPLFIIGTHCDLTDPDFTTLPKDQTGSYVDKVRYMPIFQR